MTWSAANSGFIGQEIDEFVRVPGSDRVYVQTPGAGIYVLEGGAATTRPLNLQALADATTGPNTSRQEI